MVSLRLFLTLLAFTLVLDAQAQPVAPATQLHARDDEAKFIEPIPEEHLGVSGGGARGSSGGGAAAAKAPAAPPAAPSSSA